MADNEEVRWTMAPNGELLQVDADGDFLDDQDAEAFYGDKDDEGDEDDAQASVLLESATRVVAAGLAVMAIDTGRILMIQRSLSDDDPAAGKWEFPGGMIESGEIASMAAVREWQEEVGVKLPEDALLAGGWQSGVYRGYAVLVPSESLVKPIRETPVSNPDDPDGDGRESIAWVEVGTEATAMARDELRAAKAQVTAALDAARLLADDVIDGELGQAARDQMMIWREYP